MSAVSDYPANVLFRSLLILVKLTGGLLYFITNYHLYHLEKNYVVPFYPVMLLIRHLKRITAQEKIETP